MVTRVSGCPRWPAKSSRPCGSLAMEIHEPFLVLSAVSTTSTLNPGSVCSASAGVPTGSAAQAREVPTIRSATAHNAIHPAEDFIPLLLTKLNEDDYLALCIPPA